MANEPKKNSETSNAASGTSNAASGTSGTGSNTPGAASKPPVNSPSTPPASTPSGTAAPGGGTTAGSTGSTASGASSATKTNASTARPITSTPAYGDPTVDRLSLDPADSDDWVTRTKMWVEENPALAIIGAIGVGLLVGRIVTAAIPDPEPKTLTGKIEQRAKELSKQGRYYADDAGDVIGKQLAVAAEALGVAAHSVSKNAKHGYAEAKDFSETVAEAIGEAFSKKASSWLDKLS